MALSPLFIPRNSTFRRTYIRIMLFTSLCKWVLTSNITSTVMIFQLPSVKNSLNSVLKFLNLRTIAVSANAAAVSLSMFGGENIKFKR